MAQQLAVLPSSMPISAPALPCALDHDEQALSAALAGLGQPGYRARQVFGALHKRWVGNWEEITDLPGELRARLAEQYRVTSGELVVQAISQDGTRKRLVRLADGQ